LLVDALKPGVMVPEQYVKDGKIVLNIAPEAINNLSMTKDWVTFDARFSGVLQRIRVPVLAINAIYAAENGRGMFFDEDEYDGDDVPPEPAEKGAATLRVVK
jgi:stringent starvation protein B